MRVDPMTVLGLQDLHDYACWANERLFEVIGSLATEAFVRPVAGGYGSIRNTLVHVEVRPCSWTVLTTSCCGSSALGEEARQEREWGLVAQS